MDKQTCYTHNMDCYLAIKKNQIHAMTQTDIEYILKKKKKKNPATKCYIWCDSIYMKYPGWENSQTHKADWSVVPRVGERMVSDANGKKPLSGWLKIFLDYSDVQKPENMLKSTEWYILNWWIL